MELEFKNYLFKSGDLGIISLGGIYNPSVIKAVDGNYIGVARVEPNYDAYKQDFFGHNVYPTVFRYNPKTYSVDNVKTLYQNSYDVTCERIEDFRLIPNSNTIFNDYKFSNSHISTLDGKLKVRQQISNISANIENPGGLSILNNSTEILLNPNNKLVSFNSIEKNFGFIIDKENIKFIYSIDPWIVCQNISGGIKYINFECILKVNNIINHKQFKDCNLLSVSSLPIDFNDEYYLMFAHYKEYNFAWTYRQIAILIDKKTLLPVYYTPKPFLYSFYNYGKHDSVIYVSSCIKYENKIHIFGGIGDSHSGVWEMDINDLTKKLQRL